MTPRSIGRTGATHCPTPAAALWDSTLALHRSGRSLMQRVLPGDDTPPGQWSHYPPTDAVDGSSGTRWFYHCHDVPSRPSNEHGHFHLFIARRAMPRRVAPLIAPGGGCKPRPSTVHIAALVIDKDGLPTRWVATNRWVTNEWLYPAATIVRLVPNIEFAGPEGDPLVGNWLTAMVRASIPTVSDLLDERDRLLLNRDPGGEDRAIEIVAERHIDLEALVGHCA